MRTVHYAQAEVEEQAGYVAAQSGGVRARNSHLPVGVLIAANYGSEESPA